MSRVFGFLIPLFLLSLAWSPFAWADNDLSEVGPSVIGGEPAGSWPSQVALLSSAQPDPYQAQFCGGTLIEPSWVLTAAHCVTDNEGIPAAASSIQVSVGENDLNAIEASDRINVADIRVINGWNPSTYNWDFALLELSAPSSQPIASIIQPSEEYLVQGGSPGQVAGWGCAGATSCVGFPSFLRQADLQFVSDEVCQSPTSYGADFISETMICAGNFETGLPDTCQGDSGGPLVALRDGGQRILAGITSWGRSCALPNYPGVYSRVSAARSWIESITGKTWNISASVSGSGKVVSNPTGIDCPDQCSSAFKSGVLVELLAQPGEGWVFDGWSGACQGTGSCQIDVTESKSVVAAFSQEIPPVPPAPPKVSLQTKPPKRSHSSKAVFRFTSSSGATFSCRIDKRSWQGCRSPRVYKNLRRGKHVFRVRASVEGQSGPILQYNWAVVKHR